MDGTVLEESDSSDDEGRPEEEAGFQGDNFAIDDETGTIAWDSVVDRTKRPTRAAAAAAAAEEELAESGRRCCSRGACPRLPVALAIFLLPCVLLVPYYAAIFGTTVTSVNNILVAQVGGWPRGGEAARGEPWAFPHTHAPQTFGLSWCRRTSPWLFCATPL